MKIDSAKIGSVSVVAPRGTITLAEAAEVKAVIEAARNRSAGRVVLDMGNVPYVDSAALEMLMDFAERHRAEGQIAKLAGLTDNCREILVLTDMIAEFEAFDSIDSAVRSFL